MPKYKLQEMPDMQNEGKHKVYPKMVINRSMDRKEFIKRMKDYNYGTAPSVTEAVLENVEDMLVNMLSMGYNVNLGNLGTYSLSLGFEDDKPTEMKSENDKMLYRHVGVKGVNVKVSAELVKEVKLETDKYLERDMGGVSRINKKVFSREERIARALEVIETNGFISLSEYASINNLSRSTASKDLKSITADKSSPIDSRGQHSHKVWVRRENRWINI